MTLTTMTVSIYKRYLNDLIKLFIMTKENNEVKKERKKNVVKFFFSLSLESLLVISFSFVRSHVSFLTLKQ